MMLDCRQHLDGDRPGRRISLFLGDFEVDLAVPPDTFVLEKGRRRGPTDTASLRRERRRSGLRLGQHQAASEVRFQAPAALSLRVPCSPVRGMTENCACSSAHFLPTSKAGTGRRSADTFIWSRGWNVSRLRRSLNRIGNPVDMLRNAQLGPYQFPIKAEFSNWRDEQEAWRNGAVLFDQSFHMTDHHIAGPDVKRLMSDLAVNSMRNFRKDIAKQVVFCAPSGTCGADAIMFILEDDRVKIVNKPTNRDWVQYHIETGDYDVEATTDERALTTPASE